MLSKKDYLWSYIGNIMKYSFSFVLTPVIVLFLEKEELGLWYTFASINAIAGLLDMGFTQNFLRNYSFAWGGAKELSKEGFNGDSSGIPNRLLYVKLMKASSWLYFLISSLALVLLVAIGTPYIDHVMKAYDKSYTMPWLVYAFAIFINLLFGWCFAAVIGTGAVAKANQSTVLGNVANFAVVVAGLLMGWGIISLSLGYLLNGVVSRMMINHCLHKEIMKKSEIKQFIGKISNKEIFNTLEIIWYNAKKNAIVTLATTISSQLGTLICSGFISVEVTASYGLCNQIASVIATLAGSNHTANTSVYAKSWANNEVETARKMYSAATTVYFLIFCGGSIGALAIGIPVMKILKPSIELPFTMLALVLVTHLCDSFYSINIRFIATQNRIPYVRDSLIALTLVLIFYILFLRVFNFGVYGLIAGKFLAHLYNYIKWNKYVSDMIDITVGEIFAEGFRRIVSK